MRNKDLINRISVLVSTVCLNSTNQLNIELPMRNLELLSIITIMLFFVGCKSGNKTEDKITESTAETHQMTDTPKGLVKKYVEENTYIDVDIPSIAYGLANPSAVSGTISGDDMAKAKAAIYRFYKNVSIVDGYLICSIRSGADINVSDSVFTALSENLNDMNSYIKEAKAKGETVNMFEPDENYLNSLLE